LGAIPFDRSITVTDTASDFIQKLVNLAGKWTSYAGFGTFLLYLFGYLTLRFQLNTFGIVTNLDVFDEKYFFAGCRFLVYLGMTLPSLLFLLALTALLVAIPFKLLPRSVRERLGKSAATWLAKRNRASFLGCAVALIMIQFLLRQCLFLNNLLLASCLPAVWISSVFLASDTAQALYFSGLVAGIGVSAALLVYSFKENPEAGKCWLNLLVSVLVAIECLLLPINYGMLIASRWLPRVAQVNLAEKLPEGTAAWLVWENKEVLTYLVRDGSDDRKLITVPRKDSEITIVGEDQVFQTIFAGRPFCK
jgi:hypothetical protein